MTSPESVGEVSVDVVADVRRFAKSLKSEVEKAFRGLDLSKAIQDSIGRRPVTVRVEPSVDLKGLQEKVRNTRLPKVRVEADPVLAGFQAEVRRQTALLAKQINAQIPVTADTAGLRAKLGAELAALRNRTRIEVPTDPAGRAGYEAKLRAQLAETAARVRQTINVDVDVDRGRSMAGLTRGLSGLLSKIPLVGQLASGFADLAGAIARAGGSSVQMGSQFAGSLAAIGGPIGSIVAAVIGLAVASAAMSAGLALAVPVLGAVAAGLSAVAGLAASLPGLLAGVSAGVATIGLGFRGIGAAFKPKAGGGGGGGGGGAGADPAAQARRIAGAERGVEAARRGIAAATRGLQSAERGYQDALRGVTEAQARYAKAQQAVNRARREAKEDIEDLGRALRGAFLDEEDAALAVDEALRALDEAKLTGNLPDIARADLAYRQARLTLENAKDTVGDLGEEQKDAAKKGVEGSDKVQGALEDQAEALQGVRDAQSGVVNAQDALLSANDALKGSYDGLAAAQDSLREAQKKLATGGGGGGGGALGDVVKLAPAAKRFVDAVKALKPAFEALRLDVQQRLFAGLDKTVSRVGSKWIPALRVTLGSYATTFNGFFKNLGNAITTPKFITDMQVGAESVRGAMEKIGASITSKLVPAFGTLSAAAGPFIQRLGKNLAGVVTKFSEWIQMSARSGRLTTFFGNVSDALDDVFETGTQVARLIGNLFRILFNGNGKKDKSAVDSFNDGLKRLNDFLESPAASSSIEAFLDGWKQKFKDFSSTFDSVNALLSGNEEGEAKADSLGRVIGRALIAGFVAGLKDRMKEAFTERPWYTFFSPAAGVVHEIKKLLGIESPSTVMAEIGRFFIQGFIDGFGERALALLEKARRLPGRLLGALGEFGGLLVSRGRDAVSGLMKGIGDRFPGLRQRAGQIKSTITNFLRDPGAWLKTHGANVVGGLSNGIASRFPNLSARARAIRTTVLNSVSGAGSWLVSTGANVIRGLWNGIASLSSWLYNRVASFARNYVSNAIRSALGIASPSKVAAVLGREVPAGLAAGIDANTRQVEQAALRMAQAALPQLPAVALDLGMAGDAAISRSLTVDANRSMQASWAPDMTGDKILDALRGSIQFQYRGNVAAALGSA